MSNGPQLHKLDSPLGTVKAHLATSVLWLVWSRGFFQGISLISIVVVARLLSPSDYGLMALVSVWTGALVLVSEMGLGVAIVQFRDLDESEINACFWSIMAAATVGYVALYASATAIATWFGQPRLSSLLRVAGIGLLLISIRVIPDGVLRKRLELHRVVQANMVGSSAGILVTLTLAWTGAGVWSLVAGELVSLFVQALASFAFAPWRPGFRIGYGRFREIINYSMATTGARACWAVYSQADAVVLGKVSGDIVLGLYAVAKQLAILPTSKVTEIVNQLAYPMMARLQDEGESLRASILRSVRLVSSVVFPLCAGLALVAHEAVTLFFTPKWIGAVPILQVLCLHTMVRSLSVLFPPVLQARYRTGLLLRQSLVLTIILPTSIVAGAVWAGATGVALVWVTIYPVLVGCMVRQTLREVGVSWGALWQQVRPALAATAAMSIVVLAGRWSLGSLEIESALVRLASLVLMGALTYGGSLVLARAAVVDEFREVAGWVLCPGRPVGPLR